MEFLEITEQEYDKFARKHMYRNFLNSSTAINIKQASGWSISFVGVYEHGELLAATGLIFIPCMKKYFYVYAQRGFLIDYQDKVLLNFFHEALCSYLKNKKVVYLKIDPYVQYQEHDIDGNLVEGGFHHQYVMDNLKSLGYHHQGFTTGFQDNSQVRWMFVLSLDGKDEEQLLAEMDHQTRWSINKTIKQGVKVRQLAFDELSIFKEIMNYASSTREFHDMPFEQYQRQIRAYGEENAKVMMAYLDVDEMMKKIYIDIKKEQDELEMIQTVLKETPNSKKYLKKEKVQLEAIALLHTRKEEMENFQKIYGMMIPIAASYFILYEDELVYVSSGAYDTFRKYNGPYAIQWHMMKYALVHGIKRYNFYGTSGEFHEGAIDYGVFEFKKGFNGLVEEYVGDFILPISNVQYKLYTLLKKLR